MSIDAPGQAIIDATPIWLHKDLQQGQFVVTGAIQGRNGWRHRLGYCLQVRKGVGQFGSDQVLLRHSDGRIVAHENQFFRVVPEDLGLRARKFFKVLPEQEDWTQGFGCDGVQEVGFLIENPKATPSPETASVAIIVHSPRGAEG